MYFRTALVALVLTACQVLTAPSRRGHGGGQVHEWHHNGDHSGNMDSHESRPHFRWRPKVGGKVRCHYNMVNLSKMLAIYTQQLAREGGEWSVFCKY